MRIVANLDHQDYKITLFHSNQRLILKLENSQGAVDLKLSRFQSHEIIRLKENLDHGFYHKIDQIFSLIQEVQIEFQKEDKNANDVSEEDEII